jgi:hypothetical protein
MKLKEIAGRFGYTVRLHDPCGKQSFTMEQIENNQSSQVDQGIEKFFSAQQMTVNFYNKEKLNFVAR